MTTIQQATERLTAAREALRSHLSPVMTRDHEKRDRLAAEVDAAAAELWLAEYAVDPTVAIDACDFGSDASRGAFAANSARWWDASLARHEAGGRWENAVLSRHNRDVYAVQAIADLLYWLRSLPLPAVDDCRDLDFGTAAMATSSTRARATRRAA